MSILFNVKEIGDILSEAIPRVYKTTRIVNGRMRPMYVVPTNPTINIIIDDDHIKFSGLIHRFNDVWFKGKSGQAAQGDLLNRLKEMVKERYPNCEVVFSRETNKMNTFDTAMTYRLKYDKENKMASTGDLFGLVEMFKKVYEFGKIQTF